MKKKTDEIVYVIGTDRRRTELDDILDKIVLEKDYETYHVKRTHKQNTEILAKSHLKVKK